MRSHRAAHGGGRIDLSPRLGLRRGAPAARTPPRSATCDTREVERVELPRAGAVIAANDGSAKSGSAAGCRSRTPHARAPPAPCVRQYARDARWLRRRRKRRLGRIHSRTLCQVLFDRYLGPSPCRSRDAAASSQASRLCWPARRDSADRAACPCVRARTGCPDRVRRSH